MEPSSSAEAALGPNASTTALGERVDETGHERRLGSHDGQVHPLTLDRLDEAVDVVHGDVEHPRVLCDPGVARRAQQLRFLGRACQGPHERVLPAACANDEYLHNDAMNSSTPIAARVS